MDDLKRALRDAAMAHTPDRARIHARVERGKTAPAPTPSRPRTPWLRVATATAAVAAVLAAAGYTATRTPHPEHPPTTSAATPPSVEPPPPGDALLWTDGAIDPHSNRYWAQSNITFKNRTPLSALTVEVRVAQTGGVADTGNWRSLPEADFKVSVREENNALTYTWTLRPGRTVPTGEHIFAAQYNHAEGGRDARGDRYTITTTTTTAQKATATGTF